MELNTCLYCKKIFSYAHGLRRHYLICKQKDIQEIKEQNQALLLQLENIQKQYEKELQTQKEYYKKELENIQKQYESQLQTQQEQYETKNQMLEQKINEQREQIEKLENQIFEIAKQPKQILNHNNTTNNNQKTLNIINQLAPYDLTVEKVQEMLDSYALEKVFKDGPNSIADFVVEKILTDTTTNKPKLIATDRSRGVFKYKDSEGNVHIDNKLTKTTDILQRPLFQANDQILLETLRRHNFDIDDFTRRIFNENSDLLNSINKEKLSARLSRRLESEYVPGSENSLE
jgi:hypothetical protein